MKLRRGLFILFAAFSPALSLDDLPIYLDAGCQNAGIPKSNAQGPASMEIAQVSGGKCIPITCTEALRGSDAAVVHNTKKFANGDYFDFDFKWADDRSHSIKNYKDLRMWIKNKNSTAAKFRIVWESANSSTATYKSMEIPGSEDWTEYVSALSDLGADSVSGLHLSYPLGQYNGPDTSAPPLNILIDSITVTDGTNNGSLAIPAAVRNKRPSPWPSTFLTGSFDNRDLGTSTVAEQGGCSYRYQYVMPDIESYYSPSGKGYIYDYAMASETLGVKTAIVWYNLGKSGEGYSAVTGNLQSASYMKDYVDRYEWLLDQMAQAGQSDYMIIIEPDMYGFIMRGDVYHPADVSVNMARANEVTGKTYASTLVGWAQYIVSRAREKLPKGVILGHMPNHWGVNIPGQVGQGPKEAHIMSGITIGEFIKEFGPDAMGDVVFVEKTDHDAGGKPADENWFWDSTGYGKYFLWTRCVAWRTGLPIVGWQIAEGNMNHPVTADRDNAVETFLAHPQWWVDGGFIGILFGAGNPGCANYKDDNDNGWFVQHMNAYNASPYPFPATNASFFEKKAASAPNPIISVIGKKIRLSGYDRPAFVRIYNLSGKCLISGRLSPGASLDAAWIHSGFYIACIESVDRLMRREIVVSRE